MAHTASLHALQLQEDFFHSFHLHCEVADLPGVKNKWVEGDLWYILHMIHVIFFSPLSDIQCPYFSVGISKAGFSSMQGRHKEQLKHKSDECSICLGGSKYML